MTEASRNLSVNQALDLGVELTMRGDYKSAEGLFRGVLIHEPENFEAISRLGVTVFEQGEFYEALYWFGRALKLDRKNPMALTNHGLALGQLGHAEEGLPDLERAVYHAEKQKLSPEAMATVYNNLGNTLERIRRYPEALEALDKCLAYNRDNSFALYNRGIVLLRLNQHKAALHSLDRALGLNPNDPDCRYNRGMGRLLLGDLKAFDDYEYRLLTTENEQPNLGLPADLKWDGQASIEGKTILIHFEQGLGDAIQFARFLPLVEAQNPKQVLVIAQTAVRELLKSFQGSPGVTTVLAGGDDVTGQYDCWAAVMSLPLLLGIDDESKIPAPWCPPIDATRIAKWRGVMKIEPTDTRLQVGVVWAGNFRHKNDHMRSIALKEFAALFDAQGCNFISLQQMRPEDTDTFNELQKGRDNLKAIFFEDLRDTAAAILSLDVVVTADTAVAHLAASLGVPTLILIPKFATDWRWQLERDDSPWYPTAKLIRQGVIGKWGHAIHLAKRHLEVRALCHTAAA